jgi:isoquinoline 1-oxidoreductase beta subunit
MEGASRGLSTDKSTVIHSKSKRSISYGDVAKVRQGAGRTAEDRRSDLKKRKDYKLIGRKDIKRVDVPVEGERQRQVRHRRAGAGHGLCLAAALPDGGRQGRRASTPTTVKKIKGVTHVLPLPFGVAVGRRHGGASRLGRQALKVKWDTSASAAAPFDSEKAKEEYAKKAADPNAEAMEAFKTGDADKALSGAATKLEAAYWSEHTYHAQMEPMNAVASVAPDGQSAEIWVGTQVQPLAAAVAAGVLKTTPDKIKINNQLLGGGFGRRIWPDAPVQAVVISNIVKKPVKLMLTREDDLAAARPRPMTHHVMKAGLDDKKNLVSWHHRIVAENVDAVAAPPRFAATKGRDYIGWVGMSQDFYKIPNLKADAIREQRGMRVHAWRGIGAGYNKFVSESFVDEVAAARGVEPLAMRLELTKDQPRAQAVIKAVAEMSNYTKKRPGRGMGSRSPTTTTRSLRRCRGVGGQGDRQDQGPQLLDRGRSGPRHPAGQRQAQIESAIVYALSGALSEELSMKGGAIQQSNFNDYHVLRMSDSAGAPHQDHRHRQPADRHGRGRHPHRCAGDRQCGGAAHRQAAAPPADVIGPGEEGAGVTSAFAQPCPPRPAGDAAGFFLRVALLGADDVEERFDRFGGRRERLLDESLQLLAATVLHRRLPLFPFLPGIRDPLRPRRALRGAPQRDRRCASRRGDRASEDRA